MPTIEELTKQFEALNTSVSTMKKDFQLQLDSAKKDADSWKSVASQKEEELKQFKEKAELALKERDKAFAESRKQENLSFLESLKKSGKISPAMEDTAAKLMESMTSDVTIHTFEAKDGKKVNHTQLSLFKELLGSLTAAPIFRQMSKTAQIQKETPGSNNGEEKTFTTVKTKAGEVTYEVDGQDLHSAAIQYQEDQRKIGRTVSYAEALIAAEKLMTQAT